MTKVFYGKRRRTCKSGILLCFSLLIRFIFFIQDKKPLQCQHRIHDVDGLRRLRDESGKTAGRNDLDIFLIQFLFDAVHDLIDLSDETVIDPCLHRRNGIAANDARRLDQLDARKLRGSLEEGFHGDPDARCDSTAQIVALGV